MSAPEAKTPKQQIKEQIEQYQKSTAEAVVEQFRQITLEAERVRARSNEIFAQVNATLQPQDIAPHAAGHYGVFRNPITGTLMVLSNVLKQNKSAPIHTGTFTKCTEYINRHQNLPFLCSAIEIAFDKDGLELVFNDPFVRDESDLEMTLKDGVLHIQRAERI